MDLILAFIVFMVVMVLAVIKDFSVIIALLVGLVLFMAVGMKRKFTFKELCTMSTVGLKESLIVIEVMAIIGVLTAVWRVSNTITIFVYYGMQIIQPSIFLMVAFLLACLLSYGIGTSFGVAGTIGVIFMTLARSGGVDPVITAGVLMSGIYFGDRCSPVSSSANLVAAVTGTKIFDNVKLMMKTGMPAFILCCVVYTVVSVKNPIAYVDEGVIATFEEEFVLSLWSFVPAIIMIILPLLKLSVLHSMGISITSGILIAWLVVGVPFVDIIKTCIFGYEAAGTGFASLLNGGGLLSMTEIIVILIISCMYSGIFNGTKMLESLQAQLNKACTKIGRFSVMIIMSIVTAALFCNQTIATLMCSDLLKKPYEDLGATKEELAIDMENSVILLGCLIPWGIGWAVPMAIFGEGVASLPWAVYMYMVPILTWVSKRKNDR